MSNPRKQLTKRVNTEVVETTEKEISVAEINGMTVPELQALVKERELPIEGYYDLKSAELKKAVKEHLGLSESIPVIDNIVSKQAESTNVVAVQEQTEEPKVRIKPNRNIRTFIGDQWYSLDAGKVVSVPKNVKLILERAGMLSPL